MNTKTSIEWTDATWNPLRGCSRVSEGCRNCYAEKIAYRFSGAGQPYEGLAVLNNGHASWTGKIDLVEKHLLDPLKWETPRLIFVNSMSDLFHENVTDEQRDRIFAVMALCPQHTFQVLTKRPERMIQYALRVQVSQPHDAVNQAVFDGINAVTGEFAAWPLPNVWLGVSVEDQPTADERIPVLLQTPAAVRFISAEPLLGNLALSPWLGLQCTHESSYCEPDTGATVCRECEEQPLLDWVICGGESGPGARPMHPGWARSLRDQCVAAGVPYFFKQWGEWAPNWLNEDDGKMIPGSEWMDRVGKKAAGSLLDGRPWRQMPEVRR